MYIKWREQMPQKYAKEGNGHKYTIGIKLKDTSKQ